MNHDRDDGKNPPEFEEDSALAAEFGPYASYTTASDPIRTNFHAESPAVEMDRLLDRYCDREGSVLDLGCGAGFTLCRLAKRCKEITGIDLQTDLLHAARRRIENRGLTNVTLVVGDVTDVATTDRLPERAFKLCYSRRGPFLNNAITESLATDALFILELAQDYVGLKEVFGRTPFLPRSSGDPDPAIAVQAGLGFVAVSAKSYWYEEFFRDSGHLAAYLKMGSPLSNWWMEACPYDPLADSEALQLFAKYNKTVDGVRLIGHRRVYVFRREATNFYPARNP